MSGFYDVTVVVEGAVDETETFTYGGELPDRALIAIDAMVARVEAEAEADGLETEVYIQHHGHALDVEDCTCAQYETDHHPDYEWNTES